MTCRRDPTLKPGDGVHEVLIRRKIRWAEAQDQMVWLVAQPDVCGTFHNGRRYVRKGDTIEREEVAFYLFSDADTAFRFRLQFS